jgi:hypothetical protein
MKDMKANVYAACEWKIRCVYAQERHKNNFISAVVRGDKIHIDKKDRNTYRQERQKYI